MLPGAAKEQNTHAKGPMKAVMQRRAWGNPHDRYFRRDTVSNEGKALLERTFRGVRLPELLPSPKTLFPFHAHVFLESATSIALPIIDHEP